jgi:hypothetical protein
MTAGGSGSLRSANPDQVKDPDEPGIFIDSERDEPCVAQLGHPLTAIVGDCDAQQPVIRVVTDPGSSLTSVSKASSGRPAICRRALSSSQGR